MNAFLRPDEIAVRQRVRDYFRYGVGPDARKSSEAAGPPDADRLLRELGFQEASAAGPPGGLGLLGRALIIEEVSSASPELGRVLATARSGPDGRPATEGAAAEVAWFIGAGAALLDGCLRLARAKGLFESTLMGYQQVQVGLSEVLSGLEAARLQAYRAFRLIERGEQERGKEELGRASRLAAEIYREARALAAALAGEAQVAGESLDHERNRT